MDVIPTRRTGKFSITRGALRSADWGAHAPSRALCGASPQSRSANAQSNFDVGSCAEWAKAVRGEAPQTAREARALPGGPAVRAFTLIELLVVITVIAILMALLFPAFKGVQDQAKRTQAKNDLTQIVTAVNAFYTEYGKYPVLSTIGANGTYDASNNDQLFNVLRGTATAGEQLALNPKAIAFISPPVAKDPAAPRSGLGQNDGKYYDPWGTAYQVRLDVNYANWVITNPPYQNAPTWGGVNTGALAWSYGKDQQLGDKGNADATTPNFDDVLSWQ